MSTLILENENRNKKKNSILYCYSGLFVIESGVGKYVFYNIYNRAQKEKNPLKLFSIKIKIY